MGALIRLEFHKLVRQKPFWITWIILLILALQSYLGWVNPFGDGFRILTKDGTLLSGRAAVMQDRQYSECYRGTLTDEKVKQILQNERDTEEQAKERLRMAQTAYITVCAANINRLVGYYFLDMEKVSGGDMDVWGYRYGEEVLIPVRDVFPESAMPLYYEYSVQWGGTLEAVVTGIFLLNILVFLGISPVFSEERARKMNALLFTSKFGRRKCFWAKTLTAYAIGTALAAVVILLLTLITLLLFGTDGLQCSIQLVEPFLYQNCPEAKTVGAVIVDAALLSTAGLFFTISLTILASVLARNSLNAAILSLALFVSPVVLRIFRIPDALKLIAPVNRMFDFTGVMSLPDLSLGGVRIAYSHAAAFALLFAAIAVSFCAGAVYNRCSAE